MWGGLASTFGFRINSALVGHVTGEVIHSELEGLAFSLRSIQVSTYQQNSEVNTKGFEDSRKISEQIAQVFII